MLKIESISKAFGEKSVLRNVSLSCGNTGITAIMGSSGIGKTTLLNIIAGLETADSGTVTHSYQRVSYKFQEPRLFDWLTAVENVQAVLDNAPDAGVRARELLISVGLSDSLGKYPNELSGGMQQRVALARALGFEGDLLLLDEPFSAVDEEIKKQLIALIKRYGETHAVILVTHDKAEAEALGATVIELN